MSSGQCIQGLELVPISLRHASAASDAAEGRGWRRLDAIGAIGIARCLTFGGAFGRTLHDPAAPPRSGLTRHQYTDAAARPTTLNHFHEKLLKLKVLKLKLKPGHSDETR